MATPEHGRRPNILEPVRHFIDRVFHRGRPPGNPGVTTTAAAPDQTPVAAASPAIQADQVELAQRQAEIREEAKRLAERLSQLKGKKALIIIVNEAVQKRDSEVEVFNQGANARNIGLVTSPWEVGEDAVYFYQAFREAESSLNTDTEPTQRSTQVILVLGGHFGRRNIQTRYKSGLQIADAVSDLSRISGWEMPKLIGDSNNTEANNALRYRFPASYLVTYNTGSGEVLNSINSLLESSPK